MGPHKKKAVRGETLAKARKTHALGLIFAAFSRADTARWCGRAREERVDRGDGLPTRKGGSIFRVGVFLDFVCLPHVLRAHMGRTCGEPDEIELTPMEVKLNGSGRVRPR